MKVFVNVREITERSFYIDAPSVEEAEDFIRKKYKKGEIELTTEDFKDYEIEGKEGEELPFDPDFIIPPKESNESN
jgi:hypothetical protein